MKKNTWTTGLIGSAAAITLLKRYGKHSGATWAESQQPLPSDEVFPNPELEITNAIRSSRLPKGSGPDSFNWDITAAAGLQTTPSQS